MRAIALILATLILLGLVGLAVVWHQVTSYVASPTGPDGGVKIVTVPEGLTVDEAVALLVDEEVVAPSAWLDLYIEHLHVLRTIKPGEYALCAAMTPAEQIFRMEQGEVVTHRVTIPPGAQTEEIIRLIDARGLGFADKLTDLAFDPLFAHKLGIAGASVEGYLFPGDYDLPRGLTAEDLLRRLVARFRANVTPQMLVAGRARGLTEHELVTLASLIETAPVPPAERRQLAALLHNRLAKGKKLRSAASVAYGLARMPEELSDKEKLQHPWNTEKHVGLPPTPIASPSLAALMAAAQPAASRALYRVPRDDGSHDYCETRTCRERRAPGWVPVPVSIPKPRTRGSAGPPRP